MIADHVECHPLAYDTGKAFDIVRTSLITSLAADLDVATIALWLGHSHIKSSEIYIHADMTLKEKALARVAPTPAARDRYRPPDKLLAFLEAL